jgi:DNA-binding CsgD family transcriptional regulator
LAAAEAVVAEPGDVVAAEVFDLVSRLVDKSMVSVDEGVGGEPLYRLLETLRAYALDRASNAGELGELRATHARWWAGWVEQRGAVPTDSVLAEVEAFHANLKSALDWSVDEAEVGLRLLAGVARPWQDLGRAQEALPAADRLLADEHAVHHPSAWLEAAWRSRWLYFEAQDPDALRAMTARVGAVAEHVGDEYYRALGRLQPGVMSGWSDALQLAHGRGDRFEEGLLALIIAGNTADDEPAAAMPAILEAERLLAALGVRSLELGVSVTRGDVWAATGPLDSAIELARTIVTGPFSSVWREGVRLLSYAGLMARDQDALALAVELVRRAEQRTPGPADWIDNVRRRAALLSGEPSAIHPDLHEPDVWPPTNGMLWLASREAIDAGAAGDAVSFARRMALPTSHAQAALAAIEAAASGDESRWHDALTVAMAQGLRLIAVDALEGLATTAAGTESWVEALRLLGAAERLRDETGYRWRFGFEQVAVDGAREAATMALGESAATAEAEGRALDWREAAAYARRARGERGRPQHGWASLTPTETQVVVLVAEGLTNPEIAERLLMGRATVKTHLAHVFRKLGVHTRAELAAEVVRHAT